MKRQKVDDTEITDVSIISKELEDEYKRQIEFFKAEEKKAKDRLREQEITFLKEKQSLESKLEEQYSINSDLKLQIMELQREVLLLKGNSQNPIEKPTEPEDVSKLQQRIDSLISENKKLQEIKLERDEYCAQGCVNALKWKVVHLIENPLSQQQQLKQNQPSSISSTPSSNELLPGDNSLKEEIETLKKRIDRMKELYASQTNRLRDAIYQLTGWNIDLSLHENRLRLRSRYAANRDDDIELIWKGTDDFVLLDTAFVNNLDSQLFVFLTVSNSYPAFLSAVTQSLFEKQTMYTTPRTLS